MPTSSHPPAPPAARALEYGGPGNCRLTCLGGMSDNMGEQGRTIRLIWLIRQERRLTDADRRRPADYHYPERCGTLRPCSNPANLTFRFMLPEGITNPFNFI